MKPYMDANRVSILETLPDPDPKPKPLSAEEARSSLVRQIGTVLEKLRLGGP